MITFDQEMKETVSSRDVDIETKEMFYLTRQSIASDYFVEKVTKQGSEGGKEIGLHELTAISHRKIEGSLFGFPEYSIGMSIQVFH